jgi:hypothetical protein
MAGEEHPMANYPRRSGHLTAVIEATITDLDFAVDVLPMSQPLGAVRSRLQARARSLKGLIRRLDELDARLGRREVAA